MQEAFWLLIFFSVCVICQAFVFYPPLLNIYGTLPELNHNRTLQSLPKIQWPEATSSSFLSHSVIPAPRCHSSFWHHHPCLLFLLLTVLCALFVLFHSSETFRFQVHCLLKKEWKTKKEASLPDRVKKSRTLFYLLNVSPFLHNFFLTNKASIIKVSVCKLHQNLIYEITGVSLFCQIVHS